MDSQARPVAPQTAPPVQSFGDFMAQPAPAQTPQADNGDLPHPDLVDQQTTIHAQTLAGILARDASAHTSALMADDPPAMRPARLPLALRIRANSPDLAAAADAQQTAGGASPTRTGAEAVLNLDPTGILPGLAHAGEGLVQTATGANMPARAAGLHKALGGAFEATTPFMGTSAMEAPIRTAVSLASGMVSQTAVAAGLKRMGLPPEYADLAGDAAGIIAGVGTHKAMSSRAVAAIKARVEPVLQARADKAAAPEASANSTGTQPNRPAPKPSFDSFMQEQAAPRKPSVQSQPAPAPAAQTDAPLTVPDMARERFGKPPAPVQRTIEQPGASDGKQSTAVDAGAARPVDAGGTGEGAAVHGTTPPGPRRFIGKATTVLVPGEDRSIPAHYEARELDDINASHVGETFAPNRRYKLKNERDYSKPENQQRVIEQSSEEKFEPRYHINNDPDMANGPPLLFDEDEGPDAVGANSRVMHAQRVYARNGRKAQAYRDQFRRMPRTTESIRRQCVA